MQDARCLHYWSLRDPRCVSDTSVTCFEYFTHSQVQHCRLRLVTRKTNFAANRPAYARYKTNATMLATARPQVRAASVTCLVFTHSHVQRCRLQSMPWTAPRAPPWRPASASRRKCARLDLAWTLVGASSVTCLPLSAHSRSTMLPIADPNTKDDTPCGDVAEECEMQTKCRAGSCQTPGACHVCHMLGVLHPLTSTTCQLHWGTMTRTTNIAATKTTKATKTKNALCKRYAWVAAAVSQVRVASVTCLKFFTHSQVQLVNCSGK